MSISLSLSLWFVLLISLIEFRFWLAFTQRNDRSNSSSVEYGLDISIDGKEVPWCRVHIRPCETEILCRISSQSTKEERNFVVVFVQAITSQRKESRKIRTAWFVRYSRPWLHCNCHQWFFSKRIKQLTTGYIYEWWKKILPSCAMLVSYCCQYRELEIYKNRTTGKNWKGNWNF